MQLVSWLLALLLFIFGVGILRGQHLAQHALVVRTPAASGSLDGCVYYTNVGKNNARTRVPIRGARIRLAGMTAQAVSNGAGHFRLQSLPAGAYTLTVFHPAFRDAFTTTVTIHPGAFTTVSAVLGQGYYVAVGVAAYGDPDIPALVGPVYDVKAVNRALFQQFHGHATLLINRQATKARIKAAILSAAAQMSSRDFFIFYFSGHGGSDRLRRQNTWINYLLPYDSRSDSYAYDISERELARWLKALPAPRRAMLILDSCDAGSFLGSLAPRACLPTTAVLSSLSPLKALGCTVLAAAGSHENSVDEDDGSLFTDNLIEGLERHRDTVDVHHTRAITVKELFRYAAARTTATAKDYDEQQHPLLLAPDNPVLLRY